MDTRIAWLAAIALVWPKENLVVFVVGTHGEVAKNPNALHVLVSAYRQSRSVLIPVSLLTSITSARPKRSRASHPARIPSYGIEMVVDRSETICGPCSGRPWRDRQRVDFPENST
jgi:hypothetical protein